MFTSKKKTDTVSRFSWKNIGSSTLNNWHQVAGGRRQAYGLDFLQNTLKKLKAVGGVGAAGSERISWTQKKSVLEKLVTIRIVLIRS